ncbi:MAG TPA: prohibitin family protein [Patescibacteria group bacterium]|nr:prohibitin family protein [Patescibacteria group bacterium]
MARRDIPPSNIVNLRERFPMMEGFGKKLIVLAAVLLIGGYFFLSTVIVVDAGHTGVKKTLGKVDPDAYPPGVYIVMPMVSSITQIDNRVMKMEDQTAVYTKDVQQANIRYAINYSLEPSASVKMYTDVGGYDWAGKLIPQVITSSMKNVIGQWAAMDLIANRLKAQIGIEEMIASQLKSNGIRVTNFSLTNIDFQDQFEQAVEAKVVAVQSAEMAKNQTVQIEEQAKQRVIAAKADAEAMQIKNEALSKNQALIMYEAVQKWDGQLPRITGGGSGGNFLNIPEGLLQGK